MFFLPQLLFLPFLHASKSPFDEASDIFVNYQAALANSDSTQLEEILSNNFQIDKCGRGIVSREDLINSMKLNKTNVLMRDYYFREANEGQDESMSMKFTIGDYLYVNQYEMQKIGGKMMLTSEKITECGRNMTMTSSLIDDPKMMAQKIVKDYIAELTTPNLNDLTVLAPSYEMNRCGEHYSREKVVEIIRSLTGQLNRRLDSFQTQSEVLTDDFKGTFFVNIYDGDFDEVITFDVSFSPDGNHKITYEHHGVCYLQDVVLPLVKISENFANFLGDKYNLAYRWNELEDFKNVTSTSFNCNHYRLSREEYWLVKGAGLLLYCKIVELNLFEGEGEFLCEHDARFFVKRIDGVFKITKIRRETCVKRDLHSQLIRNYLQDLVDNYIDGVNAKDVGRIGKLKIDGVEFNGDFNKWYPNRKMPKMFVLLGDFGPENFKYQFFGRAEWTLFNYTAYRNEERQFTLTHENRIVMNWKIDYEQSIQLSDLNRHLRDTFKDRTVGKVAFTLMRAYLTAINGKWRDLFEKVTSEDFRVIHLVPRQRNVDLKVSRTSYFLTLLSNIHIYNLEDRRYFNFDIKNGDLEFWIDIHNTTVMLKARLIDNSYYRIISEHRTFSEKQLQYLKSEAKINSFIKNNKL